MDNNCKSYIRVKSIQTNKQASRNRQIETLTLATSFVWLNLFFTSSLAQLSSAQLSKYRPACFSGDMIAISLLGWTRLSWFVRSFRSPFSSPSQLGVVTIYTFYYSHNSQQKTSPEFNFGLKRTGKKQNSSAIFTFRAQQHRNNHKRTCTCMYIGWSVRRSDGGGEGSREERRKVFYDHRKSCMFDCKFVKSLKHQQRSACLSVCPSISLFIYLLHAVFNPSMKYIRTLSQSVSQSVGIQFIFVGRG